jgi:hypothetical protein
MAKFTEFRTPLPFSLAEYEIGSRYTAAKIKLLETGGEEGFESVISNEQREHPTLGLCNYSYDILHLRQQLPSTMRTLAPTGSAEVSSHIYSRFPNEYTEITNPEYMKENFHLNNTAITTDGSVQQDNALNLSSEQLGPRSVETIDFFNDQVRSSDMVLTPELENCVHQARGETPLANNWQETETQQVVNYQYIDLEFRWWGLQDKMEITIIRDMRRIITMFHRRMYFWLDQWHGMTIQDVEAYEAKVVSQLNDKRQNEPFTGMTF